MRGPSSNSEGIPSLAKVGDTAAYGFVLINMLAQPPDFRLRFLARCGRRPLVTKLPDDALAFAEARQRQTEVEQRYRTHTPSHPELRDQISRLAKDDQAASREEGIRPQENGGGGPANCWPAPSHLRSIRRTDLRHGGCAGGDGLCGHGAASAARSFVVAVLPEAEGQCRCGPGRAGNARHGRTTGLNETRARISFYGSATRVHEREGTRRGTD